MDNSTDTTIPYIESSTADLLQSNFSTEVPSIFDETGGNPLLTIVLIIVALVIMIALIFGLAVFIDCRHQKLSDADKKEPRRHLLSINLPKFFKFRRFSNDEESFADKIYSEEQTA